MIALYIRVSTEEQATKGYSVEGQIEDCRKLAGTNEYLQYVDDGYTGEILNRPGLMRMQHDIEEGLIDKVICYDPDRLSRKLLVQLTIADHFQKHGVQLEFVKHDYKDDPEGQLFFQVRGAFAEYDKAKIKLNTMTGRYRKAKKGLVVKDSNLYGYRFNKEKSLYSVYENEAKVVRLIFNLYTDPKNEKFFGKINGIALYLTGKYPTKTGKQVWHRQVVRQILLNEAYTGRYIQNRYDTVGDYVKKQSGEKVEVRIRPEEEWLITEIPALITQDQFEYAQELLDTGKRRSRKNGIHSYLLSGLVRCGRCGCTMTGRKGQSHGQPYFVYQCKKNYAGAKLKGCGRQMSENKLNSFVWEKIIGLLDDPSKIMDFKEEAPNTSHREAELQHIEGEIEKTKKGRKRLYTLISLGDDDDLDLTEIKAEIKESQTKEKALVQQYTQLYQELKAMKDSEPNEGLLEKAIDLYLARKDKEFTFEEKQELLRILVKEITIIDSETVHIQLF